MKASVTAKKRHSRDPFRNFKKATVEIFGFLVTDYGFELKSTTVHEPECEIEYRNETTGVTISYEWGGVPSVVLSRLELHDGDAIEAERFGLKFLAMVCCPDRVIKDDSRPRRHTSKEVERVLRDEADLFRVCGHEVLRGDFGVFPRLRELAEVEQRRVNLELYGSETGETIRSGR